MTIAGNRLLTVLTNILFRSSLTDMETCYKVMRADIAKSLPLSADRFEISPRLPRGCCSTAIGSSNGRYASMHAHGWPGRKCDGVTAGWRCAC